MGLISFLMACGYTSVLTWMLLLLFVRHSQRLGLVRTNFRGEPVVSSLGIAPAVAVCIASFFVAVLASDWRGQALALATVGASSAGLGFLDDRLGSRSVGGFRGHFGELLQGRVTTGAVKALVLPPAAWISAVLFLHQGSFRAGVTALLVSLGANTLNLLDVRPARAVTAWLAGAATAVVTAILLRGCAWPVLLALGPALVYLPFDAGQVGMLGDAGANFLGASLGLGIALSAPLPLQIAAVGGLIWIQSYSESHSLNAAISSSAHLAWLDAFSHTFGPSGSNPGHPEGSSAESPAGSPAEEEV